MLFFAHISAKNDSNLIFRASLEFDIIHLHNPCMKNLNIVAQLYAMDQNVMQDFFFQILQCIARAWKKSYRGDFKNLHYFLSLFFSLLWAAHHQDSLSFGALHGVWKNSPNISSSKNWKSISVLYNQQNNWNLVQMESRNSISHCNVTHAWATRTFKIYKLLGKKISFSIIQTWILNIVHNCFEKHWEKLCIK